MRMIIPLGSLATLLDLPAGVEVTAAGVAGEGLELELVGVEWESPKKGRGGRAAAAPERITADYSVDAAGRRTFNAFKLPDAQPEPPRDVDPQNTNEKE